MVGLPVSAAGYSETPWLACSGQVPDEARRPPGGSPGPVPSLPRLLAFSIRIECQRTD